ncbi:MAG: polysaccharide deacetylase family protein [Proteobacteria bacterium]|nr:polysaccharide deacetylase family protein [Pseudomonadota bacterium]
MIINLMYHRVTVTNFTHEPEAFEQHLKTLVSRYPIVVPGDYVPKNKAAVCLTFDDAYYDFYHVVFPLLKKYNVKAVLAIPVKFILDTTSIASETRLKVPYNDAMNQYESHATLCTWQEIQEMVNTGLVIPASHSYSHRDLTKSEVDLKQEVIDSKSLLQEKTQCNITTFVYPYGKMTRALNRFVKKHYEYAMRIGSALNLDWQNFHGIHYRVDAEKIWPLGGISENDLFSMGIRFLNNSLRFK